VSWVAFAFRRGLQQCVIPTKALWLLHLSIWKCLCILPVLGFHGSNLYTNTTVKCGKLIGLEYNAVVFRMWHSWNICKCHPTLIASKFHSPFCFSVCPHFVFTGKWQTGKEHWYFRQYLNCALTTSEVFLSCTCTFSYPTYTFHISINPINQISLLAV